METRTRAKRGESLPRSAFLLAFDLRKEKLANRRELGYLLRAAALAELMMGGNLADESGKARAVTAPAADAGSLQVAVWEQIASSPPRSWRGWIGKDRSHAYRLVRDELAAAGLIRVERRRILLFPVERITPRRPYVSRRLAERVGRAVRGSQPIGRLGPDVRVLAALAIAARLKAALSRRERHLHKERIEQLSKPVGPIATALRKSVEAARRDASGGG
ncbi:GPP34 family phosphoprotein [Nonomuraea sp. M3C6]|uniref:GPP34 family phosphoprotein n=1 Tax=Nonomuraea marmarensis TaxID=3351344 RepID=A0ABW7AJJ7_9ACTN